MPPARSLLFLSAELAPLLLAPPLLAPHLLDLLLQLLYRHLAQQEQSALQQSALQQWLLAAHGRLPWWCPAVDRPAPVSGPGVSFGTKNVLIDWSFCARALSGVNIALGGIAEKWLRARSSSALVD